uniref:Uncharacterized protein n=1 Tax=Eptatretus burgeri TaxID=7764 RepID=A0A8C4QHN5_EPTBU
MAGHVSLWDSVNILVRLQIRPEDVFGGMMCGKKLHSSRRSLEDTELNEHNLNMAYFPVWIHIVTSNPHVPSLTLTLPIGQWQGVSLSPIERVQTAAVALGCLFLLASLVWLVWSGLSPAATWQRRDVLFQVCYALYGLMDIVCIGLLVHEGPAVYRIMKRWRAMNQRWKVLNYNKDGDLQGKGGGGRSVLGLSAFSPLRFHFGMLFLHLLERFGSSPLRLQRTSPADAVKPKPILVRG